MSDLEADVALSIASVVGCEKPFYIHKAMAQKAIAATIESLRYGAVERAIEARKKTIGVSEFSFEDLVDAILGPEPETEPGSPDESDIADLRYDASRAEEKDES
jgi:hypothetical protein